MSIKTDNSSSIPSSLAAMIAAASLSTRAVWARLEHLLDELGQGLVIVADHGRSLLKRRTASVTRQTTPTAIAHIGTFATFNRPRIAAKTSATELIARLRSVMIVPAV